MADLSQDLFRQLAAFAFSPTRTSDRDIALQIMRNSNIDFSDNWRHRQASINPASGVIKTPKKGPSFLNRIVDILMRGNYAVASVMSQHPDEPINPFTDPIAALKEVDDVAKAYWEGLSGKRKQPVSEVLEDYKFLPESGPIRAVGGLAADILLDPTTAIPIPLGTVAKAGRRGIAAAIGKEVPKWAQKKGASVIPVSVSESLSERAATTPIGKAPQAFTSVLKAVQDAPAVSAALEETTKRNAIAEAVLSPQQAALASTRHIQDAREVLKGVGVSLPAKTTYNEIIKGVMAKNRSVPQKAIDRHASKIALNIASKPVQQKIRGEKGQFLKYGTKVLTFPKGAGRVTLSPSSPGKIIPIKETRMAGRKIADIYNRPRPHRPVRDRSFIPAGAPQQFKPDVPKAGTSSGMTFAKLGVMSKRDVAKAKVLNEARTSVTNAMNKVLPPDEEIRVLKPGETVAELGQMHNILSRVRTFQGQKDIRPRALDAIGSARAAASTQIALLDKAMKGFTDDEILEAWNYARYARPRELADERLSGLADVLTGQLEKFFRSRAVPEHVAKGNSVAMRAGMVMKDLNKMLARYRVPFQFTNKKMTDPVTGGIRDYSRGTDWLYSWETKAFESGKDVKEFIFGVTQAAEQLSREYAVIDDLAAKFGKTKSQKGYTVQVAHEWLKGVYFPKEIADQISIALSKVNDFYRPSSPISRATASAVSMWKSGVTKYHPRHHIINMVGDVYLSYLAGVTNPDVYRKAAKVMFANKGRYSDLKTVDELVSRDAVKNAMTKPGSVITKNKSDVPFTAEQIYIAAFNYGLLQKTHVIEDIVSPGGPLGIKPFGGKLSGLASAVSENRDHYAKLAHFIDVISKSRGKDIQSIFENAAHVVRKWHPDGLDLTKSEQKIRAYLIPFYSWTRKSIPLLIEGAVMNPKRAFLRPAQASWNIQQGMGIDTPSPSDPFPIDQMFPEWIREEGSIPMARSGMGGLPGLIAGLGRQGTTDLMGNPITGAYTLAGPTNPMQQLFSDFGGFSPEGIRKGILGQLNPGIKIPLEMGVTKEVTYTGQPLYGNTSKSKAEYVTEQIPILSQIARITGYGPFGPTSRQRKEGFSPEPLVNWATGAGIIGTGAYVKQAQIEHEMGLAPTRKKQNEAYRQYAASLGIEMTKRSKIPDWLKELYHARFGGEPLPEPMRAKTE